MINIYSQSGQVTYGIKYYTVDTENEKNNLPTKDKMGSKCYVIESETWYILNGNGEWVPFVGEDSTADAILISIKNMSAEQKNQLKEELDIGGGGEVTPASIVNATGQMTEAQTDRMRANIVAAQDALRLTATPTAGPSGTTLMIGTWSGATWEQIVTAIQNSRLIQIDVTNIGKITLLYNLGSATNAASNAFVYVVDGILYNVFAELFINAGNNCFALKIINARTETVTVSGTTPTITPEANTIYNCGELTSLTITDPPATGKYSLIFFSGATATVVTGIDNFTPEANKRYRISVENGYATYDSWSVGGGT